MIWFFAGLAIVFFFAFVVLAFQLRAMEELNQKAQHRLLEAINLARHWQERAKDAERALKYNA